MATTTVLHTDLPADLASGERVPRRVSDVFVAHGGRILARVDRGLTAAFSSATEAVRAAIALQQVCAHDARPPEGTAGVRVGVHVGDVVGGTSVDDLAVMARHLCLTAAPATVVVSDVTRQLAAAPGLDFCEVTSQPGTWEVAWRHTTAPPPVTVVVAEDSVFVRAGVVALLREEGFDVLAEVGDRDALLAAARTHRPALVVTDVRMPPDQRDEGIAAAAALRAEDPSVGVLVLSQHIEPGAAVLLLERTPTAVGYLLKERVSELDEFIEACRTVVAGGVVIDPLVTRQLLAPRPVDDALGRLTQRERDVLELMAQGRSNAAIARAASCSTKTLEAHIRSIFTKLDLPEDPDDHRRVAAVVRYLHSRA